MRKTGALAEASITAVICWVSTQCLAAQAVRWDYVKDPVRVSEVPPTKSLVIDTIWPTYMAATAFDGFGSQGVRPAAVRGWNLPHTPTPHTPAICEIDYGRPVAVSAFVHYFYVPGSRDLRFLSPAPSAFRNVRILSRKDGGSDWKLVATLSNLSPDCPQILRVRAAEAARYWRLEVLELAAGAEMLMSYEIETYTGGEPHIVPVRLESPNLPAIFARHIRVHQPSNGPVVRSMSVAKNREGFDLQLQSHGQLARAKLKLLIDDHPTSLHSSGKNRWRADLQDGYISIQSDNTLMGILLDLTYTAKTDQPIKYRKAASR